MQLQFQKKWYLCPGTDIKIFLKRLENKIIISNEENPRELYAEMIIETRKNEEGKNLIQKTGIDIPDNLGGFEPSSIPHGRGWINMFTQEELPENPFELGIDPKAYILEFIGLKLAKGYIINPSEKRKKELNDTFPNLKGDINLKGFFGRAKINFLHEDFEKLVFGKGLKIRIEKLKYSSGVLFVDISLYKTLTQDEYISDNEIIRTPTDNILSSYSIVIN